MNVITNAFRAYLYFKSKKDILRTLDKFFRLKLVYVFIHCFALQISRSGLGLLWKGPPSGGGEFLVMKYIPNSIYHVL